PKHAAACVLPFYLERRTASVRRKRQVSWLVDPRSAAPSHPDGQWHSAASLPTHSGGPAPDLHRTSLFTSAPMARKTAFTVFTCGFIIPARRTGWQEDLEGPIQKGIVAIPWKGGEGARPSAPKAMRKQSFVLDLGKEGRIIRGDLYAAEDARRLPTLVILHGFKGFKDWGFFPYAAETLAKRGFGVITFNFSMNGVWENLFEFTELDKFARNTYSREQEDVAKIIGEIKAGLLPPDGTLDPDRLGLIGHSRGGANSLLYALEDPNVKGVVTWNGVADVDIFPEELKREIREKGVGTVLNAR